MYLVKSPFFLKWYYAELLWNKPRSEKTIYITFDDGPIPIVTPFVLKTLAAYNAMATFFCIGDNITKHPGVFEAVLKADHSVGNHTFNHLNGWKTNDDTYVENFLKAQTLTQTHLFRPPYGRIKKSQIERLKVEGWKVEGENWGVGSQKSEVGSRIVKTQPYPQPNFQPQPQPLPAISDLYPQISNQSLNLNLQTSNLSIVMWDVLSGDFDTSISPEKCYQNVIRNTQNGSIIVFHDSLKAFDRLQSTLPRVLNYFAERGFRFESL